MADVSKFQLSWTAQNLNVTNTMVKKIQLRVGKKKNSVSLLPLSIFLCMRPTFLFSLFPCFCSFSVCLYLCLSFSSLYSITFTLSLSVYIIIVGDFWPFKFQLFQRRKLLIAQKKMKTRFPWKKEIRWQLLLWKTKNCNFADYFFCCLCFQERKLAVKWNTTSCGSVSFSCGG